MIMSYLKALVAVVGAVVTVLVAVMSDGITTTEWVTVAIAAVGALQVYFAANLPTAVWDKTKLYVAAASAGLTVIYSFLADGIGLGLPEWWAVGIAVLTAVGVYAAPN